MPFTPFRSAASSPRHATLPNEVGSTAIAAFGSKECPAVDFPPERIRNFSIIAHIDHGKSTLADRMIEVSSGGRGVKQSQLLDKLQVERDRGITVKANSASVLYKHRGEEYLLNMVDTPGHVDFSYEVSRSLAACDGVVLLVDAAQGIQAQTVANFYLAYELELAVVPVINKIDLPAADPPRVAAELEAAFELPAEDAILCSAKAGVGVSDILAAVVEKVPPPSGDTEAPCRLLLFDAHVDEFRGVICMVLVKDGVVRKGSKLRACSTGDALEVLDLGILAPDMQSTPELRTGQVGFLITGLRSIKAARVGDTWQEHKAEPRPLPGFRPAKAMMFAGIYPLSQEGFERLDTAVEELTLNDGSVAVKRESSNALGPGFRCGFLGTLHMDVFMQRLAQEHGEEVLTTTPMVPFRLEFDDVAPVDLESPLDFPKEKNFARVLEPTVNCTIITPDTYTGAVLQLCASRRGELLDHTYLTSDRCMIRYQLPLAELAGPFYGSLKACTSGYGTFDYEEGAYREADLVRLDFLVHGAPVDALTRVLHRSEAVPAGRAVCKKLVDVVSRQSFEVAVQAAIGNKVIARESIRATRKDVLAKCYGGDITRKKKLLEKQREGKSKMRKLGAVSLEPDAFHQVMSAR